MLFATKFNEDTIKPVPSPLTQMCDNYREEKEISISKKLLSENHTCINVNITVLGLRVFWTWSALSADCLHL